jgi:hypothetical protein
MRSAWEARYAELGDLTALVCFEQLIILRTESAFGTISAEMADE